MPHTHIICVGAVYIDTILDVPHFPHEDTKLRAAEITRRRGGNTANTLEVLSQLLPANNLDPETLTYATQLSLLAVLPDQKSLDTQIVMSSLPDVSPELLLYREGEQVAASSYIMRSKESRTIVSANPLEEMTVEEFKRAIESLIPLEGPRDYDVWVHFEGRVPDVTLQCVQHLRERFGHHGRVKICVECEKPERTGMKEVAALADVVVYSRLWAEANIDPNTPARHIDAESFIRSQCPFTQSNATLICTWGKDGATALRKVNGRIELFEHAHGWRPSPGHHSSEPIDNVGAGDTFIAGILYALSVQKKWGLAQRMAFATELAGRKVYRQGFQGLGEEMRRSHGWSHVWAGDCDFAMTSVEV